MKKDANLDAKDGRNPEECKRIHSKWSETGRCLKSS